jgi:NADH:ubiquinone oxidoreductase subunit 5 (subunit L)/multisubunit Na+/H+ antiporter MnhA subunit
VTKRRSLILPLVIVGILLVVVAIIYFVEPAKSLPSFFPGHDAHSSHHHTKHGIAALVVALGCFVLAWFQTGPARSRQTTAT